MRNFSSKKRTFGHPIRSLPVQLPQIKTCNIFYIQPKYRYPYRELIIAVETIDRYIMKHWSQKYDSESTGQITDRINNGMNTNDKIAYQLFTEREQRSVDHTKQCDRGPIDETLLPNEMKSFE